MEKEYKEAYGAAEPADVESKAVGETFPRDVDVSRMNHDGTANLLAGHDQLQRGLKSRHIQFLALGGAYVLQIVCAGSFNTDTSSVSALDFLLVPAAFSPSWAPHRSSWDTCR